MSEELIVVRQLPVIEEHLRALSDRIDNQVTAAASMACTADTVKDVKKVRAALNKQFAELEEQRKAVKSAVLGPYEHFQKIYDECVTKKFKDADTGLKAKISDVENDLKNQKSEIIRRYYGELAASLGIDFAPFERSGINVTLSASEKSLRNDCDIFLYALSDGLKMIETQEYRDEILVDFKKSLNAAQSVAFVVEHHRLIEEEAERQKERAAAEEEERRHTDEVNAEISAQEHLASPSASPSAEQTANCTCEKDEPVYHMKFTVYGTKDKLSALKKFMEDGGYRYE